MRTPKSASMNSGKLLWREAGGRIAQAFAASIAFSALIALVFRGESFGATMLASFLMFHGAVSPIVLASVSGHQVTVRHYLAMILVDLIVLLIPATILHKVIYGPLLFYYYDYFAGVILYALMTGVITVLQLTRRIR